MSYLTTQPRNTGHSSNTLPHHGADNLTPLSGFEFPPSPLGTWSSLRMDISSTSPPQSVHVVCNAPLVAPIPLPYHSPTFLQFELPDVDQDLSHPPYTQRIPKRKRVLHEDVTDLTVPKRRSVTSPYRHSHHRAIRYPHHPITPVTRPKLHCYT